MSIRALVTRGYGTWGTIPDVVTRGYIDTGAVSAAITGTLDGSTEAQIVAGGQTTIITLTNDTWIAAGTGPIGSTANTQALIDGITSAQVEATGWNTEVRDKEVTGSVVRTSSTVATITWTAAAAYDITDGTGDETITVTIPAAALTAAGEVVGSPTVSVIADSAPSDGSHGITVFKYEWTWDKWKM